MILADSGYWVALLIRQDAFHESALRAARQHLGETLVSTWPVLTEACHLIRREGGAAKTHEFVRWIRNGGSDLYALPVASLARMATLMDKYRDLPMDLADASLVVLAEELGEGRILSTDERDFRTYRWKNTKPFTNLLLPE